MERKTRVPYFESVADVREAQFRRDNFLPADLYPRDGYMDLSRLEERFCKLVGVEPEKVLLYNSGMSAIVDALEISNPTTGDAIIHGEQLYSQSFFYIKKILALRGVKTVQVDSGSVEEIAEAVTKYRPQTIFLETVANCPDIPVLDIDRLVNLSVLEEQRPLVILDNTLPSPTALPLGDVLRVHLNTLVVESGTKFYSLNTELSGMIYTYDEELIRELGVRRRVGSILSPSATQTLDEVLLSREEFHARNRRILINTLTLARACLDAESAAFVTSHPNLPNHPNQEYVNLKYPDGVSPVFFIQVTDSQHLDQFRLTDKLWQNPVIRQYCRLGQSFGFDHTRIWPDPNYPAIRIAGGTEREMGIHQLAEAFRDSLLNIV